MIIKGILMGLGWWLLSPKQVEAVLPPDFIFNISSQLVYVFSSIALFISVGFGTFFKYIRNKKIWLWMLVAMAFVGMLVGTLFYFSQKERRDYETWLEKNGESRIGEIMTQTPDNIEYKDEVTDFIKDYYQKISEGRLEEAYIMSKKSVDLVTFKDWYKNTQKIEVDEIVRIDENKSSLKLSLFENKQTSVYAVLMTIRLDEQGKPVAVADSEVRVIETVVDRQEDGENYAVNNMDFNKIIEERNDFVVLDAREDMEYENGHFPKSIHIRMADLQAGRWIELPIDKDVYVICWSGIRGKVVADYLKNKGVRAFYLESGADGWVNDGGLWQGDIKFSNKYNQANFMKIYSTAETKKLVSEGVVLVDSRQPDKYEREAISGSFNIPIMYTPTVRMDEAFAPLPKGSRVITICDDYVNCFDAKVTGAELEKRGFIFLGRYNKPWEYGQ